MLPISTYVGVTTELGEKLFEAVRYTGAVADTRRACDYYRIVDDDRLLWGGRISTRISEPRRLKAQIRRDILTVYPQLGDVEIEHAWAGTMAYAVHKMPQIGELAPGYWLASAFGGHGLNTTAMAGEIIARAILDGDDRWRLFSSYEPGLGRRGVRAYRGADLVLDDAKARCRRRLDFALSRSGAARVRARSRRASKPRRPHARLKPKHGAPRKKQDASPRRKRVASLPKKRAASRPSNARLAKEEVERLREERRLAAEEAKRAAEAQIMRDAAEAAATLVRQVEAHKALTAGSEQRHATQPSHAASGEIAAAPQPAESSGRNRRTLAQAARIKEEKGCQ